jgi:hypothetical protein
MWRKGDERGGRGIAISMNRQADHKCFEMVYKLSIVSIGG